MLCLVQKHFFREWCKLFILSVYEGYKYKKIIHYLLYCRVFWNFKEHVESVLRRAQKARFAKTEKDFFN